MLKMLKKPWFFAATILVVANVALLTAPASGSAPWDTRACACVDGGDPGGPEPPYIADCLVWYFNQCEGPDECSCEPE